MTNINRAFACVCAITASNSRNDEHKVRFNFSLFVFTVLSAAQVCVSPRSPSSVGCGSHGATAVAFEGILFLAATNGAFVRVRVRFVCHPEHNLDNCNPYFPWISKALVQHTDIPTGPVQQAANLL